MQVNELDDFLDRYIDSYLLTDLENIKTNIPPTISGNAAYMITAAVCSGMELLGSLTTTLQTLPGCEECGKHEQLRFKFPIDHYCKHYLSRVDKRYETFGPIARELIRNGIMHNFATKGKIGITRMIDREEHLTRMSDQEILVISADYFFEDFKKSYLAFARPDIRLGGPKHDLAVTNYEKMREVKAHEIERTMAAMEGKLDTWPQVDMGVIYSPILVDRIEDRGEII
ncbi:MAG: hypothetical protein ABWX94_01805 [Candidatus Saccharimonadales bacterium]